MILERNGRHDQLFLQSHEVSTFRSILQKERKLLASERSRVLKTSKASSIIPVENESDGLEVVELCEGPRAFLSDDLR